MARAPAAARARLSRTLEGSSRGAAPGSAQPAASIHTERHRLCYRAATPVDLVPVRHTAWVVSSLALFAASAHAAEVTRVVSPPPDVRRPVAFSLTAAWTHEVRSTMVTRESESTLAPGIDLVKDLKSWQTRDLLDLRGDLGVKWGISLHIGLPIVLAADDHLDFDQGGSCPPVPGDPHPTCVNQRNSTLLRDGILPGYGGSTWGLDATHDGRPFSSGARVFQGPTRSGLESLNLGTTWAVFDQALDDTKPTWTLSFDAKLDAFKDMRFDQGRPGANTAVGLGYHQLIWSTWISKRFRYFDPYFGAWYMLPLRTDGSPFADYSPAGVSPRTQTDVQPQQQAGFTAGIEQIAWENPSGRDRVTVEARFHVQEHFSGRARSEIWEALAGSSNCNANGALGCRPGIDLDLDGDGLPDHPHSGITEVDAYATFGGDLGLNVQAGRYARFHGLFGFATDMPHFITGPDPKLGTNSPEGNPAYRPAIDEVGRRFRVEGSRIWTLLIEGSFLF